MIPIFLMLTACGSKADKQAASAVQMPELQGTPTAQQPLVSDPAATANMASSCASAVVDPNAYTRSLRNAMRTRLARGAKPRIQGLANNQYGTACAQALPLGFGTLNYDTYTQGYWNPDQVLQLIEQIIRLLSQRQWWGGGWNGGGWGGGRGGCGVEPYLSYGQGNGWGGNSYGCNDWIYNQNPFQYSGGQVPWNFGWGW